MGVVARSGSVEGMVWFLNLFWSAVSSRMYRTIGQAVNWAVATALIARRYLRA